MPVPVMMLFDSVDVMTRKHVIFTDGNAARKDNHSGNGIELLEKIPFDLVYHDERYPPERNREMVLRRNAEVCVPDELPLKGALKWIYGRSSAERDSLLFRLKELSPAAHKEFKDRIIHNQRTAEGGELFHRHRWYIDSVSVTDTRIVTHFHSGDAGNPDFDIRLEIKDCSGLVLGQPQRTTKAVGAWTTLTPPECRTKDFVIEITIDGNVAFRNGYPALENCLIRPD